MSCHMANRIHSYIRCQLWSVSGGVRICCQNCSSTSRSWDIDIQSFTDFQGSGWKPVCFLPCTSNIVTALANGAMQASVLPCPSNVVTALADVAMQGVSQARQLVSGVSNRSQARLLLQFQGSKLQMSVSQLPD